MDQRKTFFGKITNQLFNEIIINNCLMCHLNSKHHKQCVKLIEVGAIVSMTFRAFFALEEESCVLLQKL